MNFDERGASDRVVFVNWRTPPVEWLVPVADALEEAASECKPSYLNELGDSHIVLDISISRIPLKSAQRSPDRQDHLLFVAKDSPMYLPKDPLCDFSFHRWLRAKHMYNVTLVASTLALSLMAHHENTGLRWTMLKNISAIIWLYMVSGTMCKALFFKVIWTVDVWMPWVAATSGHILFGIRLMDALNEDGLVATFSWICEVFNWLLSAATILMLTCFDCMLMPRRAKCVIMCIISMIVWYSYYLHMYVEGAKVWASSSPICVAGYCIGRKLLIGKLVYTAAIFFTRFAVSMLVGAYFTILRTEYVLHDQSAHPGLMDMVNSWCTQEDISESLTSSGADTEDEELFQAPT